MTDDEIHKALLSLIKASQELLDHLDERYWHSWVKNEFPTTVGGHDYNFLRTNLSMEVSNAERAIESYADAILRT